MNKFFLFFVLSVSLSSHANLPNEMRCQANLAKGLTDSTFRVERVEDQSFKCMEYKGDYIACDGTMKSALYELNFAFNNSGDDGSLTVNDLVTGQTTRADAARDRNSKDNYFSIAVNLSNKKGGLFGISDATGFDVVCSPAIAPTN